MFGTGMGLSADEAKQVLPIGPPAHVRGVVEALVGCRRDDDHRDDLQGPWKREVYHRMNDAVVRLPSHSAGKALELGARSLPRLCNQVLYLV